MRISDWSSDVCSSDLLSFAPQRMFLTHYSQVQNAPELAQTLRQGIARYERIATTLAAVPDRHAQLLRALTDDAMAAVRAHGCRSEEHTSELQSLMRISYAVFCLQKKKINKPTIEHQRTITVKIIEKHI